MSVLGLYDHMYYDAPDFEEEEDVPTWPAETFTLTAAGGWWSAGPDLDTDDE